MLHQGKSTQSMSHGDQIQVFRDIVSIIQTRFEYFY